MPAFQPCLFVVMQVFSQQQHIVSTCVSVLSITNRQWHHIPFSVGWSLVLLKQESCLKYWVNYTAKYAVSARRNSKTCFYAVSRQSYWGANKNASHHAPTKQCVSVEIYSILQSEQSFRIYVDVTHISYLHNQNKSILKIKYTFET